MLLYRERQQCDVDYLSILMKIVSYLHELNQHIFQHSVIKNTR